MHTDVENNLHAAARRPDATGALLCSRTTGLASVVSMLLGLGSLRVIGYIPNVALACCALGGMTSLLAAWCLNLRSKARGRDLTSWRKVAVDLMALSGVCLVLLPTGASLAKFSAPRSDPAYFDELQIMARETFAPQQAPESVSRAEVRAGSPVRFQFKLSGGKAKTYVLVLHPQSGEHSLEFFGDGYGALRVRIRERNAGFCRGGTICAAGPGLKITGELVISHGSSPYAFMVFPADYEAECGPRTVAAITTSDTIDGTKPAPERLRLDVDRIGLVR